MSSKEIVERFLGCYQGHDFDGMHHCLDKDVRFSDFAFDIQGREVRAMWHWFCVPYPPRAKPIEVPEFEVRTDDKGAVSAKYRVCYLYGDKQRPVDYFIDAHFTLGNDKIIEQKDTFASLSEFEFAKMAFGFPLAALATTPLLRRIVKNKATKKLAQFMDANGYRV